MESNTFASESHTLIFLAACLAIVPLAGRLGDATEHLAHHTGDAVGGLLNATFGNAAELIIALVALSKASGNDPNDPMFALVKASITGSIIGNVLLVLGVSIVGEGACELIHLAASVMTFGGTLDYFIQGVFNFPALSDAYKYAAYDGLQALARRRAKTPGLPSAAEQKPVTA